MAVAIEQRSWWLREAAAELAPRPPLAEATSADVCIVGGGFTGLWAALRIKELEPGRDVVIVEADVCGAGASGRNGGFAMTLWHQFLALERMCGAVEAVRLGRVSAAVVRDIEAFCERHAIEAGFRAAGWFWVASNPAQLGRWEDTVAAIERYGEAPFERLQRDEVAARSGSPRHLGGVFEAGGATVQPARLAAGLRRVALERGVRVYEGSPMVALRREATPLVLTPRGRVRAGRVVIAMNAWATALRELRGTAVTVASDVVITDPAPERLRAAGLRDGVSVSDSRLMVHYCRPTADGRLAFGKGGGRLAYDGRVGERFDGPSPRAAWVRRALRRAYPDLAGVPVAASWTGPVDRTVDGLPFFTTLGRAELVCGLGYSGNGVAPSALGGRILASLALGREDEWSRCGLVREPPRGLPPEPLRYVGGRIVQAAVARTEQAEDEGRPPARLARAIARLAPAGLVPVQRAGVASHRAPPVAESTPPGDRDAGPAWPSG
jgi:putative aminophosphonate oxidoreductase